MIRRGQKMHKSIRMGWLLSGVAAIACLVPPQAALAQDAAPDGEMASQAIGQEGAQQVGQATAPGDEIVVTGYRAQNRSAIDAKRTADTVVDVLVADDIGRQPDHNLADSLRRLPGVITEFDEDEGRFVSIRGLPSRYTFISLDGIYMPNGAGSLDRSQNIENIPSYAVKRVSVFKALTPDLDGNAIGGYVSNSFHSAFDAEGSSLTGRIALGHHTYKKTPGGPGDPSIDAQGRYTARFGSDDQFGFVLAANYFDKHRDQTKQVNQWRYESDGTPYIYRMDAYDYTNDITRWSTLGRFEWKPTPNFYTALSASYFSYEQDEQRYLTQLEGRGSRVTGPEGGSWQQGRAQIQLDRYPSKTKAQFYSWQSRLDIDDTQRLELVTSYAQSNWRQNEVIQSVNFRTDDLTDLAFSYDLTAQDEGRDRVAPINVTDPSVLLDASRYGFLDTFLPTDERQSQSVMQAKIDYTYEPELFGFGFKAGGLAREFKAARDRSRTTVSLASGQNLTAADFSGGSLWNPNLGLRLPLTSISEFADYYAANPGRFVVDREDRVVPQGYQNLVADVAYDEFILAAYAMGIYKGENFKVRGGVRVERTEYDATSYRQIVLPGDDDLEQVRYTRAYTNVLPSIVGSYEVVDNAILRLGYSKAIGRPDPGDIATTEQRSENTATGDISITRGNPNLKPRRSDNFDISLEWYPKRGVQLSLAYFYKNIKDELFTRREESFEGDTRVVFTQPVNAGKAKVQGLEFSLSYDKFDFLPGFLSDFGLVANVTYLDSEFEIEANDEIRVVDQLISAPNWQVNLGLLYESGPVEAKLTYAYQDAKRLTVDSGNPALDRYEAGFDQLDAQIRYNISDNIQLLLEGRNILNNKRLLVQGLNQGDFREVNEYGASYWAGVSFRF